MIRKKLVAALALATLTLGLAGAVSPAAAEVTPAAAPAVAQRALAYECQINLHPGTNIEVVQLNDSFGCLGAWHEMNFTGTWNGCSGLNFVTDAAHPAPNGWSNAASSIVNDTDQVIKFYDAFNCAGAVLFAMNPKTYRETLNTLANNKASSVWIGAGP
jgi:hypothetical protein